MFRTDAEFGKKLVVILTNFSLALTASMRLAGWTLLTSVEASAVVGLGKASGLSDAGLKPVMVSCPKVPSSDWNCC